MNSKQIREQWLKFFESKGHLIIESKSLIPVNDPSLLWINSGVATLKDFFSGKKIPPHNRLTNAQKAIRTNDIENVGVTSRHHTFFEMLGNFSIGDYFKSEAIELAYEYITTVLKLDLNRIYITYFNEDEETKKKWLSLGIDPNHLISGSRDTNFWDVGSGPCGPCTEIFYDRGPKYDTHGPELIKEDIENDRFIEIWNIVFSQFNNEGDNKYTELAQKNIDTGAGFERIVSIMQDAPTNYDSDLFQNIIHEIEKFTEFKYDINNYFTKEPVQREINTNFKIIADHIRTVANALGDGETISNVGRGYIIRRLIRRSIYKGMQLGIKDLFLYKIVPVVKESLPFEYDVFSVQKAIKDEEELFAKTIENGKNLLQQHVVKNTKIFDGTIAFRLFETYGFPIELTSEILAKQGIQVDLDEFENAKAKHVEASRSNKQAGMQKAINSLSLITAKISQFVGYDYTQYKANIIELFDTEKRIDSSNVQSYVILDKTPFYATSGGQKHDEGYLLQNGNKIKILDVFKDKFGNHIHVVEGQIEKSSPVECFVDEYVRLNCARNHSATHLMFSVMRKVLGNHIKQLGSDINEQRFTFDFPGDARPTDAQINEIEQSMHNIIKGDIQREYIIATIEEAKNLHAVMTIEEDQYMDPKAVRIVKWADVTSDLCGGTHLPHSAIMEDFKITSVEKKQAGVYRFRVVTSHELVDKWLSEQIEISLEEFNNIVAKIKDLEPEYMPVLVLDKDLRTSLKSIQEAITQAREDFKRANKQKSQVEFDYETIEFQKIGNYNAYINLNVNPAQVKVIASTLRENYPDAQIILGSPSDNQILIAVASKTLNSNLIFNKIASKTNGRGGGSAILAMGKVENKDDIKEIIIEALNA
ncbi:alanyl-tRNA synthetase [Mycoplasmopsis californica]|uniref:Alanine--tRNA ligase n=1 Tax=Mycoplasmopsis californica TaxID=2113 RepID=A0A059XS97_9BACT|nr:alanine--tRNA ligase [Mycoplasmopsis californica]AIA29678.1 alanyl-tRNA synthetase [Mycoplasmopsis californica]